MTLDIGRIRRDFPILHRSVRGQPLVYLDSAGTAQTPQVVLDTIDGHHRRHHANVGRSAHTLAAEATAAYADARAVIAGFIGAADPDEVVFTRNATESLNMVAHAFEPAAAEGDPRWRIGPGDEVVVTEMEHHSNLLPWYELCRRTGATLRRLRLTEDGRLDLSALPIVIGDRTRVVAWTHVSNVLGTVNPVQSIVARARAAGAITVLDGAQSVPHRPVDVDALGVDLLAFSGHKMCGPTGVGVLWGRAELLATMPPMLAGGGMVADVGANGFTTLPPPARFEAGTPPIAQAVGLAAAAGYLSGLGLAAVHRHEQRLISHALDSLAGIDGLRVFGPPDRAGVISFVLDGVEAADLGRQLDRAGVQVRVGRHCAAQVCERFGVPALVRASFHVYNTLADVDALAEVVAAARKGAVA
ncbi:aminotransferase class V-fold PLP-dependent enzyme [Paractinoplanes ovalisporus]|uniref:aminotransferase class V-fold PLP-dependent enzyme n=1 Tax=Paractinoplanes ovalisporus TaxID=2810368 RepID=UPI0027DD6DC3|nr:SufS family cysteine desulfurase [Actinoplanes ovalisporus]